MIVNYVTNIQSLKNIAFKMKNHPKNMKNSKKRLLNDS